MKKLFLSLVLLCMTVITLSSCGNRHYFDWEMDDYNYVHCLVTGKCYKVKEWTNNGVGVKVKTEDYGVLFFSEGTYILVENHCPICKH